MGDLAFFYQAFIYGQRMMHALLQQVSQLYYNSLCAFTHPGGAAVKKYFGRECSR